MNVLKKNNNSYEMKSLIIFSCFTSVFASRLFEEDIRLTKQQAVESYGNDFANANDDIWFPENPKIKYMDALLIGALVGYLSVHIAEKKGYIESEDPKVKLYGALGGALLGTYLVYRHQSSKPVITKKTNPTQ